MSDLPNSTNFLSHGADSVVADIRIVRDLRQVRHEFFSVSLAGIDHFVKLIENLIRRDLCLRKAGRPLKVAS